ncbi:MAG: TonB-dependent receptor [Pseudomonadota bacterium]
MRLTRGMTLAMLIAGVWQFGHVGEVHAQAMIEEITVTAQKREENIGDVPVAISVLGREQIDTSFASNLEELQALVPSVSFRTGNTTRNSALTVRGIGTISFSVAAEPSVSTVVDGVVLGRSGQAFGDLYDLERVEVLRGPQGTLFGKNASAGVVNITTQRPGEEFNGYLSARFYQDNEYQLRGRVAGPLTDALRGSLTFVNSEFDGYVTNVFNNEKVNGYDRQGIRAMLEYDVNDSTQVLVIAEDYSADNDCCADLEARPSGRNPASEAAPSGTGLDLDQRLVDHDFETRTLDDSTSFSVQITTDVGDHTLTSITATRSWDNTEFREGDFTSIAGDSTEPVFGVPFQLHDIGPQEWRQFSQELRLASPTGEDFEYQVGFFYWNQESERNFTRDASCQNNSGDNPQLNAAIRNHIEFTLGQGDPTEQQVTDFIAANNITCNANDIVAATGFMETEFENYAVFGQGSYAFNDNFRLIAGLRYTSDDVSFSHNRRNLDEFGRRGVGVRPRFGERDRADPLAAPNNQSDTNFSGSTDETNVAGRIGGQFSFGEGSMLYATYSTGYKGPAFNVFYNMDPDDLAPIEAEESDTAEIGYKLTADWGVISLAAYTMEIENFQANDFDASDGTTITGFTNGGDVETTGFEIDFLLAPTEYIQIYGGAAFSDAEAKGTGAPLPFAPDTKYSLGGQWDFPLANGGRLQLNGSYVYTDEILSGNIGQTDEVPFLLPDYSILNASFGYYTEDDKMAVTLIGKNLTDESYATTYSGDNFRYQIPRDAERYFGIDLRINF